MVFLFLLFSVFLTLLTKITLAVPSRKLTKAAVMRYLLRIYVFNLINFTKLYNHLATSLINQQTFQLCLEVDSTMLDKIKSTLK